MGKPVPKPKKRKTSARQKAPAVPRAEPTPAAVPAADLGDAKISWQDLCALTGLTDRRHRQLAEQGYFPAPIRGHYRRRETVAGLFKYFQEQLTRRDDSLRVEQQKLTAVKRETAEENLAILRNEYVAKAEIGPGLRALSLHQRATLRAKLENELAPNLAGLPALEILERMKRAVDEVCRIFNEGTREWMNSEP